MKLEGVLKLGPYCPFRGVRTKSTLHRLLGYVGCLGSVVTSTFVVWFIVNSALVTRGGRLAEYSVWWSFLAASIPSLLLCIFFVRRPTRALFKAMLALGLVAVGIALQTSEFVGDLNLPVWSTDELLGFRRLSLVAVGCGLLLALDLLWTIATVLLAGNEVPWFAPYSARSGRPIRPRSQKMGPIGLAYIWSDLFLTDKVIWLAIAPQYNALRFLPGSRNYLSPAEHDDTIQLSGLKSQVTVCHDGHEWKCTPLDRGVGRLQLLVKHKVLSEQDEYNGELRYQPTGGLNVQPLYSREKTYYCKVRHRQGQPNSILGMLMLVDRMHSEDPMPPPEAAVVSSSRDGSLKVDTELTDLKVQGRVEQRSESRAVIVIRRPANAVSQKKVITCELNEVTIVPLLHEEDGRLRYLVFVPLDL